MTRTVAVVQARLGSRRFPEKMLATLGSASLLEWVVTRVKKSRLLDRVIVATTTETRDDRLVSECQRLSVETFRGSTDDVLGRFVGALAGDTCDTVVRICADNPFVDPNCVDTAITEHRSLGKQYTFNHRPFGACDYADGFGAEVISRGVLEELNGMSLSRAHREHVTLAIVEGVVNVDMHGCRAPTALAYPNMRFDVDRPEDLEAANHLVVAGSLTFDSNAEQFVTEFRRVRSSRLA